LTYITQLCYIKPSKKSWGFLFVRAKSLMFFLPQQPLLACARKRGFLFLNSSSP